MLELHDVFVLQRFENLRLLSQQVHVILIQILPPDDLHHKSKPQGKKEYQKQEVQVTFTAMVSPVG